MFLTAFVFAWVESFNVVKSKIVINRNRTIDFQTKNDTILESRKVLLTFTKKVNKKNQKTHKIMNN